MSDEKRSLGAGLLILRETDGKVLFVRRSPMASRPGRWSPPGGGVEEGEEPIQAAIREAEEELGPLPPLDVFRDEGHWNANPFFAFGTFLAVLRKDPDWRPRLNEENDSWGWFDPDKLPSPVLPGVVSAVRDLVERSWRWKPPHMGIEMPERTYSVVKVVNIDRASPFFLSTHVTLIDEATGKAVLFSMSFHERSPMLPFSHECVRTNLGKEFAEYEIVAARDPSLSLNWADGLNQRNAVRFAMAHVIVQGKRVLEVEDHLKAAVSACVG